MLRVEEELRRHAQVARVLVLRGIDRLDAACIEQYVRDVAAWIRPIAERHADTTAGIEVLHETVRWRHSPKGNYVSVRISFRAASRADYERAHQALRDHPEVKWTL